MKRFKSFITEEDIQKVEEQLDEASSAFKTRKIGRMKLIPIRFRTVGGKIVAQRRVKKSAVKGFTLRGGKLVRMSAGERMRRKRAQRCKAILHRRNWSSR
jgi:hypothetical protein